MTLNEIIQDWDNVPNEEVTQALNMLIATCLQKMDDGEDNYMYGILSLGAVYEEQGLFDEGTEEVDSE